MHVVHLALQPSKTIFTFSLVHSYPPVLAFPVNTKPKQQFLLFNVKLLFTLTRSKPDTLCFSQCLNFKVAVDPVDLVDQHWRSFSLLMKDYIIYPIYFISMHSLKIMKQNAKQQALLHLLELLEKSELTEKHIVLLLSTAGN